jgi:cytochrome oxidase assembly protein ShyY1
VSFSLSPSRQRAAGLVLLAVVLAVVCSLLGRWQWNRHVTRDAAIAVIENSYGAAPVPITELLATPSAPLAGADVWRPVTVVGRYEPGATALLRNRPINGQPGFQVLVPFVVTGDRRDAPASPVDHPAVLVVDRGWVPAGSSDNHPGAVPAPPTGTLEITVRLRADEPASPRDAPAGQVQAISVDQVLAAGGLVPRSHAAYGAYGVLASEGFASPTGVGVLPKPDVDPGSHLSYAFQWWTFALGSLIGFSVLARRELADAEPEEGRSPRPTRPVDPRPEPQRRRRPSDQDVEDALIDSQLP